METTARLGLPLLAPGQAQKELFHNEALALVDAATQAAVKGTADPVPADAAVGDCWIVGAGAGGEWAGRRGAVACRTAGGWRFVAAREGMAAWDEGAGLTLRFQGGAWRAGPAVAEPAGGGTVDAEARAALVRVLAALRSHGLIAG